MTIAISVIILITVAAGTWFLGVWNNLITLINLILSASVASTFFEPLADAIESSNPTYTYLLDFVCLWGLFFLTFALLRAATDFLSHYRLRFNFWFEMAGRSVLSLTIAWIFLCFTLFTLHTAPIPAESDFQPEPLSENFVGAPDKLWLAYLQSRSRGALAESLDGPLLSEYDTGALHADDRDLGCRVFDSKSDYIYKYRHRREMLAGEEQLRVNR